MRESAEKSKPSKNYCDLPVELREMCIARMDFRTKYAMRRTCRTEKWLVDRLKFSLERVELTIDPLRATFIENDAQFVMENEKLPNDFWFVRSVSFVLKSAKLIKHIVYTEHTCERSCDRDRYALTTELNRIGAVTCSTLELDIDDETRVADCLVNKCQFDIDNLIVRTEARPALQQLIWIPQFMFAKNIHIFSPYQNLKTHIRILEIWIRYKVPIGNTLEMPILNKLMLPLARYFQQRVVFAKRHSLRIITDDPARHILTRDCVQRSEIIDAWAPVAPEDLESDDED